MINGVEKYKNKNIYVFRLKYTIKYFIPVVLNDK